MDGSIRLTPEMALSSRNRTWLLSDRRYAWLSCRTTTALLVRKCGWPVSSVADSDGDGDGDGTGAITDDEHVYDVDGW